MTALLALSANSVQAQTEPVLINGALIDWYYYGKDIHSSDIGWNQQSTGQGTAENPYNYGLITMGLEPGAADGQPVWVADFPIRNHILYGNAGGVFTGDAYYSFFMHEVNWESNMEGEYGSEEWEILVRKWDLDKKTYKQVGRLLHQPTDLCYDPLYDKVYGIFYMASGDEAGYKLGTLDMQSFEVTPISRQAMQIGQEFRCLAINSQGQLYGIDASGNVAKIDKTNGNVNYIGNVGFKSQRRMMSATFDLRTDRLYWLGYMNDGKIPGSGTDGTNTTLSIADGGRDTGFYEIDTETGKATLIGSTDSKPEYDIVDGLPVLTWYGKMQLTGIYVVDGFTRKSVDQIAEMNSIPVQLKVGEKTTIVVDVKNIGLQEVGEDDWRVNFYADGQLVASKSGRDLESGEVRQVKYDYTAPAQAGRVTIYAEVVNDADQELRNNRTDEHTIIVLSDKLLPAVELAGQQVGNGLQLTWADPEGRVCDGAEDYVAFTYTGLGAWTMYDGDEGYTQRPSSYNMAVEYANWNAPKAYIVFDPDEAGIYQTGSASMFRPYAGKQYFTSFFTAIPDNSETGGSYIDRDDWMISPLLSGLAQTVSFWAKGYKGSVATGYETEANYTEKMRVLYSATTPDPDAFQVLTDTFAIDAQQWTQYTAALPAGARYFALQCVSKADEGFVLMVDDVRFQIEASPVLGYNVYKNGVKLNSEPLTATSYSLRTAAQTDEFTVTAVYADGESAKSNAISIDLLAGVETAKVAEQSGATRYYNLRGQQIGAITTPGIYVVSSNGKTRKVVVK